MLSGSGRAKLRRTRAEGFYGILVGADNQPVPGKGIRLGAPNLRRRRWKEINIAQGPAALVSKICLCQVKAFECG
jgi:hypothetical protein